MTDERPTPDFPAHSLQGGQSPAVEPLAPPTPPPAPAEAGATTGPDAAAETPVAGDPFLASAGAAVPTDSAGTTARRRGPAWLRWTGWSAAALGVVALLTFTAYLWLVNAQWQEQNAQLRAEATSLGESLAQERATTESLTGELETKSTQLETATGRITDLANEEAQAIDSRAFLEDLSKALIECADLRQDHIDVLTDSQLIWTGKTNSQVEREITTFCNELKSSYDKYLKDGA